MLIAVDADWLFGVPDGVRLDSAVALLTDRCTATKLEQAADSHATIEAQATVGKTLLEVWRRVL
jgi:NADPH:quinone reductase-like Zn-dependent oxidoreductase